MIQELLTKGRFELVCKDKNGKVIPFIPNPYQQHLVDNLHYKNLILKARQLGFSTLIQILMLDQALFTNHIAC